MAEKSLRKKHITFAEGRGKNSSTQKVRDTNDQNLQQQLKQIQQQQKTMKTYTVKVPEGIGPDMPFDVSIEGQRMTITCPSNAQAGMTLSFQCEVTNEQIRESTPKSMTLEELRASRANKSLPAARKKFTVDEDLCLWKAYKEKGRKWASISTESFHGARSRKSLRERITTLEFKNRIEAHHH